MPVRARRGAAVGASLGLAAGAACLLTCVLVNSYFADDFVLAAALFGALPAALGGAVGWVLAAAGSRRSTSAPAPTFPWFPARGLAAASVVALAALSVSGRFLPHPTWHTRVLLYGVDGATWKVMDPMVADGELPTFGDLSRDGAHGVLLSQEPVISPVVWTNIASGFTRDDHGISGFHTRSDQCLKPRLWDIFAAAGEVVGTYKYLVTWPPQELKGFQVPAWLAQGPETTPRDLEFVKRFEMGNRQKHDRKGQDASGLAAQWEFVREGVEHGLRLSTVARAVGFIVKGKVVRIGEDEAFYRMNLVRAAIDRDVFVALMDRFDPGFASFTYYPTDSIGHRFWKYFETEGFTDLKPEDVERYRDAVPTAYRQADEILAELMGRLPRDAHVVVVSDHGMVSANAQGGYFVFGLTTTGIQRFLEGRGAKVDVARVGQKLSVGIGRDSPGGADAVRAALGELTWQGRPFVKVDELSPGGPETLPLLGLSLAILDDLREPMARGDRVEDRGAPGPTLAEMVSTADNQSGVHNLDGIVIARGPKVVSRPHRVEGVTLIDVAPTVLALAGVPASRDMPGREMPFVLGPVPERVADYHAAVLNRRHVTPYRAEHDGRNAAEEMLRALGYVSDGKPPPGTVPVPPPGTVPVPPPGTVPVPPSGGDPPAPTPR